MTHPCCYKLVIDNDEFGFINYKIKSNETITDVARKFYVNDQMILDLNRHISYYDDVYPSQVITIPNSYARRIEFYIDKQTLLPLTQIIYDHKGLFSKVRFTEFRLNPPLSPDEFTRDYKAYGF
jgi:LysM repeat protein